jgi:hypothetical protein
LDGLEAVERMPQARESVIATRHLRTADRKQTKVMVSLAQPRREASGDWVCRFHIKGLGRHRLTAAHGVDSFQALHHALEAIRVVLDETGRKLSFLDMGTHFFPRYVPQYYGPDFERKLNTHIEREVLRFAREHERRYKAARQSRNRLTKR